MKNARQIPLLFLMSLPLLAVGCATIVSGRTQEVTFRSTPEDVTVSLDGRILGKTPVTTMLRKSSSKQVLKFEKEGFKTLTMQLETGINAWFFGNIALFGAFGSTTDAVTGSMYKYSPNQYLVTLESAGAGKMEKETSKPEDQRVREFIILSYRSLMGDLKAGKGEYLVSLENMLKVPESDHDSALKKLRGLSDAYPDIAEFADRVVEAFMK